MKLLLLSACRHALAFGVCAGLSSSYACRTIHEIPDADSTLVVIKASLMMGMTCVGILLSTRLLLAMKCGKTITILSYILALQGIAFFLCLVKIKLLIA